MHDPSPINWSGLVNKSNRITVAQYLVVKTFEDPMNRWLTRDKVLVVFLNQILSRGNSHIYDGINSRNEMSF